MHAAGGGTPFEPTAKPPRDSVNSKTTGMPTTPRRYPECRGAVFRPSYADDGSFDNLPASSPLLSEPPHRLRLESASGYHGGGFYPSTDTNAYFLGEDHMPRGGGRGGRSGSGARGGSEEEEEGCFEAVYPTAALVVMQRFRIREGFEGEREKGEGSGAAWEERSCGRSEESGGVTQRFFDGHTDDVTAVAVHPGGVLVASGQVWGGPACLARVLCALVCVVFTLQNALVSSLSGTLP